MKLKHSPSRPGCQSNDVSTIAYGLPGPELFEEAQAGEVVLGGCCISDESPEFACGKCGNRFIERETDESPSLEHIAEED